MSDGNPPPAKIIYIINLPPNSSMKTKKCSWKFTSTSFFQSNQVKFEVNHFISTSPGTQFEKTPPSSHNFDEIPSILAVEALRLSQVMAAWLLVATALHWARARELQAGQAGRDHGAMGFFLRWWLTQIFLEFSSLKLGKMNPFLTHIFHKGWNHQLGF